MTVVPVAARVAAVRGGSSAAAGQSAGAGAGVTRASAPVKSRPSGRASDAAAGAGASSMLDGGSIGKAGKAVTNTVAPPSSARKLLVAEFTLCMAVLAFSPLTDKHKAERPGAFMKRASATMAVFFVLALIATAGRGASRAAAGFGGLVALVLLISQRSIFTVLTAKMAPGVGDDDPGSEGWDDVREGLGEAIEDISERGAESLLVPLPPSGPLGNGIR